MQNPIDKIVAALEADWPHWQIWTVPKAIGGMIWCARRWDGTGQVLNAASADELRILNGDRPVVLAEVEQRHRTDPIENTFAFFAGTGYGGWFVADGRLWPLAEFSLARPARVP